MRFRLLGPPALPPPGGLSWHPRASALRLCSPAPGLGTYVHYAWKSNMARWYHTRQMGLLTIPGLSVMPDGSLAQDFFSDKLPRITNGDGKGSGDGKAIRVTFHLHDPEANEFALLFKSAYWIIIMQILIPLAGLMVSAHAFAQILIER